MLHRLLLCLPLLLVAPGGAAAERLIWAGTPYAPMVIREGPLRDRGYVDRMISEVLKPGLPQYQHELLHVAPVRLDRELLGLEQAVCSPAFSRTPLRQTRYAFSAALFRFLPVGVVMRRVDPRLVAAPPPPQALSLKSLLEQDLRLGVVGYRTHGPQLEALLNAHAGQMQRFILTSSNQSVLAMLARGHAVDASLVYEFEWRYFASLQPEQGAKLVWRPLQELEGTQLSYVACSANPAGRRAAAAIDALLLRPGVRERLQGLYEEWLTEPSRRELLRLRQQLGPNYWEE